MNNWRKNFKTRKYMLGFAAIYLGNWDSDLHFDSFGFALRESHTSCQVGLGTSSSWPSRTIEGICIVKRHFGQKGFAPKQQKPQVLAGSYAQCSQSHMAYKSRCTEGKQDLLRRNKLVNDTTKTKKAKNGKNGRKTQDLWLAGCSKTPGWFLPFSGRLCMPFQIESVGYP
jgi:hypothetical protein